MSETLYSKKPWLSSYGEGVPTHVDFQETFLTDFLERSVAEFPDRCALNFQGYRLTYSQMDEMVRSLVGYLESIGISKSDRVAVLLPTVSRRARFRR